MHHINEKENVGIVASWQAQKLVWRKSCAYKIPAHRYHIVLPVTYGYVHFVPYIHVHTSRFSFFIVTMPSSDIYCGTLKIYSYKPTSHVVLSIFIIHLLRFCPLYLHIYLSQLIFIYEREPLTEDTSTCNSTQPFVEMLQSIRDRCYSDYIVVHVS